jgi:methylated-DNA-[protein]-cysteine S-methyltransferase
MDEGNEEETAMSTYTTTMDSPLGELRLLGEGEALSAVQLPGLGARRSGWVEDETALAEAAEQLRQYFAGDRREFELRLEPAGGSAFERAVWEQIAAIPYGETESYGAIARALGRPDRARAVGAATGRNPLAIVVPCHRVIGSDGSLTGYAGGLKAKRTLLELESGVRQESLL